jgi:uncharacterized membrane protein YdfJ with MMPL/SSD domain
MFGGQHFNHIPGTAFYLPIQFQQMKIVGDDYCVALIDTIKEHVVRGVFARVKALGRLHCTHLPAKVLSSALEPCLIPFSSVPTS